MGCGIVSREVQLIFALCLLLQLTNFSALLELDGYGWQASLISKLTLGSLVRTYRALREVVLPLL